MKNNLDIEQDPDETGDVKRDEEDDLPLVKEEPVQLKSKTAKLVDFINYNSSQIIESMNKKLSSEQLNNTTSKVENPTLSNPIPLKIRKVDKIINGPLLQTNGVKISTNGVSNDFDLDVFKFTDSDQFTFDFCDREEENELILTSYMKIH